MRYTMKNHIDELHLSATRMLVYNSDNSMLISYFKDLIEKLVYLNELIELESKYDWFEIENVIDKLKESDVNLSNVSLNIKIRDLKETNTGLINIQI